MALLCKVHFPEITTLLLYENALSNLNLEALMQLQAPQLQAPQLQSLKIGKQIAM